MIGANVRIGARFGTNPDRTDDHGVLPVAGTWWRSQ